MMTLETSVSKYVHTQIGSNMLNFLPNVQHSFVLSALFVLFSLKVLVTVWTPTYIDEIKGYNRKYVIEY